MISKHLFGRTGHESTKMVFGGAALSRVTQEEADALHSYIIDIEWRAYKLGPRGVHDADAVRKD